MAKFKYRKRKENETDKEYYYGMQSNVMQMMQVCYKAHRKAGDIIKGGIEVTSVNDDSNYKVAFNEKGTEIFSHSFSKNSYDISWYNEKGLITKKISSLYKGHYQKSEYNYDEQGKILSSIYYTEDDQITQKLTWTYDEFGREIGQFEAKIINDEEHTNQTLKRGYDERGNQILVEQYKPDGSIDYISTMVFDEYNNEIEYRSEYFSELMQKNSRIVRKKYDIHNHCIQSSNYTLDEELIDTNNYEYKYDEQGNIIPNLPFDKDDDPIETEEVENDERGNWIVKRTFHNKVPVNIYTRAIIYFGEEKADLIHPLENEETEIVVRNREEDFDELEIDMADAKWLVEANNSQTKIFPAQRYFVLKFKKLPSILTFLAAYIEVKGLYSQLIENMHAVEIHSSMHMGNYGEELENYTLEFKYRPGYLLHVTSIYSEEEDEYKLPDFLDNAGEYLVHFGHVELLRPTKSSNLWDTIFEEELQEYISLCTLTKKPDKPVINIIEVKNSNFTTRERAVDDNFEIRDLDVNYGYGFEKFHNELMERFYSSTKGLVLFHGLPGTGKTYYIRHLLRKMASNNKVVIYMPPNMVDHLVDPAFMTFLSDEIKDWSSEGKFCVLLIEDAEPLLAKRQEGVRIQGVTNLLNMTDGLLNDMLNLQIICTFNVDLRKLDSALLRPGRLIARKEFKPLSELDANLLAQRLGIKHHFKKPATLSEIYALRKNHNTLIHDVDSDHNSSTLIDDLI
jgi:hypothetical protein